MKVTQISSVVQLGDFVVEGALDAPYVVSVELRQFRQTLDTIEVGLKRGELLEELTFGDPVHEIAELEEDEIDIGQVLAAQIWFVSEVVDQWDNFSQEVLRDGHSVACLVARHRSDALQIRHILCDHFNLCDLGRGCAKKMLAIFVRDKLHDRADVGQARLAIDEVGQVRESQAKLILLQEPF